MYLVIIVILAIIIFGPNKLPEAGKALGKMTHEFRQAANSFSINMQEEIESSQAKGTKSNNKDL